VGKPYLHTSGWLDTPRLPHGTPQHRTPWAPAKVRAPPRLRVPARRIRFIQMALREAAIDCRVQVHPYTRFTIPAGELPSACAPFTLARRTTSVLAERSKRWVEPIPITHGSDAHAGSASRSGNLALRTT
jgi:hypothetical protein